MHYVYEITPKDHPTHHGEAKVASTKRSPSASLGRGRFYRPADRWWACHESQMKRGGLNHGLTLKNNVHGF